MITMVDYWPNWRCALWSFEVCVCVEGWFPQGFRII